MSELVVVDASVLADSLCGSGPTADAARKALRAQRWAAPEHLRVETFSVIRGRARGAKLSPQAGERAVHRLGEVVVRALSCSTLLDRMRQLRDNLSGYDAAYVAAAELLCGSAGHRRPPRSRSPRPALPGRRAGLTSDGAGHRHGRAVSSPVRTRV